MRTLLYSVFFLGLLETAAWAADMKFGGEFRVRSLYDNNLTDAHTGLDDQEAFTDARFRLKVSATEGAATGVVLIDFFNESSGRDAAALNSPSTGSGTGNRVLGSEGFGRSLESVSLKEGYLRLSWPMLNLVVGRQAIRLGHGLILDDTADAASIAVPIGWSTFTLIDLFLDAESTGASSTSAYLANMNLAPSAGFGSSLFVLLLKDRGPNLIFGQNAFFAPCGIGSASVCALSDFGDDQAVLAVMGLAVDGKGEAFRWGLEADYLKGSIRTGDPVLPNNPSGRGIDLRGANALGQFGWTGRRMDLLLTGLYATGQDGDDLPVNGGHKLNINAVSPDFVLGNILVNNETTSDRDGGGIGGLTAVKLAVGWRPAGAIRGEVAGIGARLSREPLAGAPRNLGWELDANAAWQLDSNLTLAGGFGLLFAGDAWTILLEDPEADDRMIKLSTKLVYAF